jgi:hypothetical protein
MDFSTLDGNERSSSRSGRFNPGGMYPLYYLDVVAKGKVVVPVKSISNFYFFIFFVTDIVNSCTDAAIPEPYDHFIACILQQKSAEYDVAC